ncbi:MAG TPA: hypothetical protein VFR14_00900 [Candidatus Limnocylindrales bacterium]|nr:hypothetical protein [Candidatus Limnocylindrales bacterium]
MELLPLEREVLAGADGARAILRLQAERVRVSSRELTGVGFFTHLTIPLDTPRLDPSVNAGPITGIGAEIGGLRHGAGFVPFVTDGAISVLEGYTYDEPWPATAMDFRLFVIG